MRLEIGGGDGRGDGPVQFRPAEAVDAAVEFEVLGHSQVIIEGEFLRHVADILLDPAAFGIDIVALHPGLAGGGQEQAAEHADDRGLARAVGAEKAKDLAVAYAKAHPVDGDEFAETAGELFHDY